jgi:hypothetical protein
MSASVVIPATTVTARPFGVATDGYARSADDNDVQRRENFTTAAWKFDDQVRQPKLLTTLQSVLRDDGSVAQRNRTKTRNRHDEYGIP